MQVSEEISQEEHMLEMLRSEKQDLESEVCRFRVMKAKLLQQIAYVTLVSFHQGTKPAFITPPPIGKQSIVMCMSVCVCLSAIISSKLRIQSSPKFLCMLPVAMARSFYGGVVICYVLLV